MKHLLTLLVLSLLHINGHVGMDIIGGRVVSQNYRKYMALLMLNGECGGALISEKWILTAAHCNVHPSSYAILGTHLRSNVHDEQIFRIKRGITFPLYDKDRKINDIQLLELEKPAVLNRTNVTLLPLPTRAETILAEKICSVAGWGKTENILKSNALREVDVKIVDNKDCKKKYSRTNLSITEDMMCASSLNSNSKAGPCVGDSGGPLICEGKYVGIVACGTCNCGNPAFPAVFTRLTKGYLDWIRATIARDYSDTL
ncbi:granzyme A-like [Dendrobates tinctorius]|uniref:granzyme A-like n=1 Tax=Dendrobates tinctorius TaxID=92724 RepID=UPI003CC9C612